MTLLPHWQSTADVPRLKTLATAAAVKLSVETSTLMLIQFLQPILQHFLQPWCCGYNRQMLPTLLQTKPSWASWRHHNPAMPVGSEWRTCVINNSCLYPSSLQERYWGLSLTFVVLREKCKQFSTHLNTLCLRKLAGAQRIWLCRSGSSVYLQIGNKNIDLNFVLLQRPSGGQLGTGYASDEVHTLQAFETSTALQQSSSSPCFTAPERVEQKSSPQAAVKRMLAVFPNQQYLLAALACIHMNFSQPFSKIIHPMTWKFVLQWKLKYCLQSLEGLQTERKGLGVCS